jgi:hypothetical protein
VTQGKILEGRRAEGNRLGHGGEGGDGDGDDEVRESRALGHAHAVRKI